MANHGVVIPAAIAATNIDAYNRSVVENTDIDNGSVLVMGTKVGTTGSSVEVFNVSQPVTGSLAGLWMAYSGDEIVVTDSRYKGIDPDPRKFFNAANTVFSAFKPQVGDIILATDDSFYGGYSASALYVNAVDSNYKMQWGASQVASVTSFRLLGVKYISLATGGIDTQRVTAYEMECMAN